MEDVAEAGERRALVALSLRDGVGPVRLLRTLSEGQSFMSELRRGAGGATGDWLRRADELITRAARAGARVMTLTDTDYPARLLHLSDPPPVLYVQGDIAELGDNAVAVVGTRAASSTGARLAGELGAAFAREGVCVVSGLARGIDAAAHRGALHEEGGTCAVLGTGIDIAYPASHTALQHEIARHGVVVTEMPPSARPHRGSFPARNRIIAALADLVIVVEAGHTSGAMITAEIALDLGRTVAAVPGAVSEPRSHGVNKLIRDGAGVVLCADDALALAGISSTQRAPRRAFSARERTLLELLSRSALTAQQIADAAPFPVTETLGMLTVLEVDGVIESDFRAGLRLTRTDWLAGQHELGT